MRRKQIYDNNFSIALCRYDKCRLPRRNLFKCPLMNKRWRTHSIELKAKPSFAWVFFFHRFTPFSVDDGTRMNVLRVQSVKWNEIKVKCEHFECNRLSYLYLLRVSGLKTIKRRVAVLETFEVFYFSARLCLKKREWWNNEHNNGNTCILSIVRQLVHRIALENASIHNIVASANSI